MNQIGSKENDASASNGAQGSAPGQSYYEEYYGGEPPLAEKAARGSHEKAQQRVGSNCGSYLDSRGQDEQPKTKKSHLVAAPHLVDSDKSVRAQSNQ